MPRTVVLVEGRSDRAALTTLARRRGQNLVAADVAIVVMNGAAGIDRSLARWGPAGADVGLVGLYDVGEAGAIRRGLERAGLGQFPTQADLARAGFHACEADLEDELIRALGPEAVVRVVDRRGELASLRRFQRQPAQRGRPVAAQLRRFLGTRSGRKEAYAAALVEALDLDAVPAPLDAVLTAAR